ncbi:FtsX-like permease family protein [Promicromonospora soli]|uniref:Uncharacterized protein n=1 Tax=Promicromonospora soli TaxID=2035533 RepID=A0A919G5X6_9MICO|nr:FtsX-like permease family protein [Promicromonospora soli]GHH77971.1 hypothetical protein GCM10017772_40300 [Promicromonospora soli]
MVGLTDDTALFMTPLLFTTTAGLDQMLQATGTTGAILVTTSDPAGVSNRLEAAGFTVRSPAGLHDASLQLATDIYGSPVRLMVGVAFAAGTLIVALVAYTQVTEQQRELVVLKALGATLRRLRRIAVGQPAQVRAAARAAEADLATGLSSEHEGPSPLLRVGSAGVVFEL